MNGNGFFTSESTIIQRAWLALRAGLGFKGARDYYTVFGYSRNLTPQDYLAKYARQDLTKRVVDTPCDAIWSYPPEIEGASKVKKVWGELRKKGILTPILQADRLCAFDQFSILWLGLPGDPSTPIELVKMEDIKYISAHGAGTVQILNYEENPANERFGLPTLYQVQIDRPGIVAGSASGLGKRVHWTRCVHIVDTPLQGRLYGAPRLEVIFNLLDDILKVAGSSAETFWLTANKGLQIDVDKDMQLSTGDATALSDEIDEYQHQLRRVIRTRGVKVNNLGSEGVDPRGVFGTLMALLSATTGIPQRILMGAEAGQLASEQDRANWAEYVARRRFLFAQPYILTPLFSRLEGLNILTKGSAEEVTYIWPDSFQQNPLEESQTMSAKARALINLSRQSQYGTPYTSLEEGRRLLGLPDELPEGQTLYQSPTVKGGEKVPGSKKVGGTPESGGAGGNDSSGDSGGGGNEPNEIPTSDTTSETTMAQ